VILFIQRYGRLLPIALIVYWLMLFTSTHLPPRDMPNTHVSDKIEHFTAFAILAALLDLSLIRLRQPAVRAALLTILIILTYAALDELTQPLTGRTCDIHDWYADSCGTLFAISVITAIVLTTRRRSV
jgi:VanZ family protein